MKFTMLTKVSIVALLSIPMAASAFFCGGNRSYSQPYNPYMQQQYMSYAPRFIPIQQGVAPGPAYIQPAADSSRTISVSTERSGGMSSGYFNQPQRY